MKGEGQMGDDWKERERIYACWLCNFPGIGNRQLYRLLELCGGFEGVYFASREKWESVLKKGQTEELVKYTARWKPGEEYRKMRKEQIRLVTVMEDEYPERLKRIPDAPFALFVRGRLPKDTAPSVAVIGARDCSEYGKSVARQLGELLGRRGVTVVSGMAKGIDGISQNAALEAGGCSIGVLGSGVDVCYPAQNRVLYDKLQEKGAVLSAYPIGTPARAQNFPPRNRIVSGLADAVVVVEARVKSGTLITVDMALEQGREVYVVPGRVTDRLSDGCNRLIKQGAGVLLEPKEFLEELWQLQENKKPGGRGGFRGCNGGAEGEAAAEEKNAAAEEKNAAAQESAEEKNAAAQESAEKKATAEEAAGTDDSQPLEKIQDLHETEETARFLGERQRKQKAPDIMAAKLSAEAAAIYEALDFYPKSPGEVRESMERDFPEKQLAACLMELCMEDLAVQVSPGHFCRRG